MNRSLLFHFEPAPVTVTVPVEPLLAATIPLLLMTWPPLETVNEPAPLFPTVRAEVELSNEFAPFTVTAPELPERVPIMVSPTEVTTPPASIDSVPLAQLPTLSRLVLSQ